MLLKVALVLLVLWLVGVLGGVIGAFQLGKLIHALLFVGLMLLLLSVSTVLEAGRKSDTGTSDPARHR